MANKKAAAPAKRPVSPKQRKAIGLAYASGFSARATFEEAVKALSVFTIADKEALIEFGLQYKAGNMAAYFASNVPGWKARKGNQSPELIAESMLAIYAKPYPESTKPNRRTDAEHKACRAADQSWSSVKIRAGLADPKKRKPRPSANKAPEPPRELVAATPKLATKEAVNDHFATAFAALLGTVNVNARRVSPQLSSIVQDAYSAMVKLGLIKPAK
jgi:hypothetical protein